MPKPTPRQWQSAALTEWKRHGNRGIISVVTGGGKTVFAMSCIDTLRPTATLVIVPTTALLEQWWGEVATYFDLRLDEVNIVNSHRRFKLGTINIAVLNTAAKLATKIRHHEIFLIVDECHKAAAEQFSKALDITTCATLGLSATPERQYDDGLDSILVPALGPVIYRYGYAEALRDSVIVPFEIRNIVFELEPDRQKKYDKLSISIAQAIANEGMQSEKTIRLFLKRARLINLSLNRIRLTIKLVAANPSKRTLVFHEDIEACDLICDILSANGVKAGVYHSRMNSRSRVEMLRSYRCGDIDVLITCRALDEGFNVPETELGIIAASTATRRQRIQRLGRIVRPATNKETAVVYTLIATGPEITRLKEEEAQLSDVASVSWSKA